MGSCMSKKVIESAIGLCILAFSCGAVFYVFKRVDFHTKKNSYILRAEFESVDGLHEGSPVKINGVKIGSVTRMTLDQKKYSVQVTFLINKRVHIPKDSSASVATEGFLGGKFVAISPGEDAEILSPNSIIFDTTPPMDLQKLIQQYIFKPSMPATQPCPSQPSAPSPTPSHQPEPKDKMDDSDDDDADENKAL